MDMRTLRQRQALPMEAKVNLTGIRGVEFADRYEGMVYFSHSGGIDSTVAYDILLQRMPWLKAVHMQTMFEFPENEAFIRWYYSDLIAKGQFIILRPESRGVIWTPKKIIETYGYAYPDKENAQKIYEARTTKSEKLRNIRLHGDITGKGKIPERYMYLVKDQSFLISHYCCHALKKRPFKKFERETGLHPMLGELAEESALRTQIYLKVGCNAFNASRPVSRPIFFWTKQDIWEYVKTRGLPYSKAYDMGYERTGCVFCTIGINHDKTPNRFERLKVTHPAMYRYAMNELGLDAFLTYLGKPH